jgi:beta-1,2-mannobiose phosphorylase / 1,2-beta-oligomannan phosphorylase
MMQGARNGWLKSQGNPVLGGKYGTCFDLSMLRDGDKYRMFFSWRPRKSIALSESDDGFIWSEPRVVLGPKDSPEGWEDDLNRPSIVKVGGLYHLWYTGQYKAGAVDGRSWIFHATSHDGVNWLRCPKPVLRAERPWEKSAVMCPHVEWDGAKGIFMMWYSGGEQYEPNAIGYASSEDGDNWIKYESNPIFMADPANEWERHKAAGCQVFFHQGWYVMFYIGYFNEHYAQIGMARSRDGITDWQRYRDNPIIAPDSGAWDGEACYKPFVLHDGKRWMLWYNGRKGALEQIGVATRERADLGFDD